MMIPHGRDREIPRWRDVTTCSRLLGRDPFQVIVMVPAPSKHVAQRLGRPAAKALAVAGHDAESPRREPRLDAGGHADGPGPHTAGGRSARRSSSAVHL